MLQETGGRERLDGKLSRLRAGGGIVRTTWPERRQVAFEELPSKRPDRVLNEERWR